MEDRCILVVNAGSSSVKFTAYALEGEAVLARGLVERIGLEGARIRFENHRGETDARAAAVTDARAAVREAARFLTHEKYGVLTGPEAVVVTGHRVVHGGEKMTGSAVIDEDLKRIIQECAALAPLHNPPNLAGIAAAEELFPLALPVAVFDTAFHAGMPEWAYLYGLPRRFYEQEKIRRYGFHGTSHKYVSEAAARFVGEGRSGLKMIVCHLGNGCSVSAVDGGRCVDTSMGFTPLEGVMMGARCGDIDPAIIFHLMDRLGLSAAEVSETLNKKSGLLGLADIGSGDVRDIIAALEQGDRNARSALETFCYRIKKYIGAYAAALGGLDVLVFTAGIGENSPLVRDMVCRGLGGVLGLALDPEKNEARAAGIRDIGAAGAKVRVLVAPTDEELEIARQTRDIYFRIRA